MIVYNEEQFKKEFEELKYDSMLRDLYSDRLQLVYSNYIFHSSTLREDWLLSKLSVVPLWYLNFLRELDPTVVADIGCGANIFKSIFKKLYNIEIIGIDPVNHNGTTDSIDFFDHEFSEGHKNLYQCAFSICAIHFIPITELKTRIYEFYNIIKPGGRGFLALNAARLIENTSMDVCKLTFKNYSDQYEIQKYIVDVVNSCDIDFIVKEIFVDECFDQHMDGNIRLVFNK